VFTALSAELRFCDRRCARSEGLDMLTALDVLTLAP
jgi:hypothetical protein